MFAAHLDRTRWLKADLAPLKPVFVEAVAISFFTNLLALVVPLFSMQVYDRVVAHNGTATLAALVTGVLLALAFDFILRQARSRLLQSVALTIDAQLGRRLYETLSRLPLAALEGRPASQWQQYFLDLQSLRTVLAGPTAVLFVDLPFSLIFLLVLAIVAPSVAWLMLFIVPAFVGLAWWSSKHSDQGGLVEHGKMLGRDRWLMEMWVGRGTAKANGALPAAQGKFEALHADAIRFAAERGRQVDVTIAAGQSLALLTTISLVSVGALAILNQSLTSGALIAATMLGNRILMPCNQLVSTWKGVWQGVQAAGRLGQLFALPVEMPAGAIEHPRPRGQLTCERVAYHFAVDRPPVLENIGVAMEPGQMIGLMGRNGCGKTTLLKLLQGLYHPTEGRVLLDGADLRQFGREELTRWFGYVPQECILFSGTIRDNIAIAHPEATDEMILRAAELSGAAAIVSELPDGYGTEVGEGGARLSGGLRQRIAIARALVHDPAVLLCDEVTSNLDHEAEIALRTRLLELAKTRAVIVATHSLPMLSACQSILVLEKGRIAAAGPAQEVLKRLLQPVATGDAA